MPECYLTIDDSPTPFTDEMCEYLTERDLPALLFVRGDMIESYGDESLVRAVKAGFILGNHSLTHRPFGTLDVEECISEIEATEVMINRVYHKAGIKRPGKFFRFPYLDRGNGDRIERHFEDVNDTDINQDAKVAALQDYLKQEGFYQPFKTCHPVYNNTSIREAADCLMTYSSYDWMLLDRHRGHWDYKTPKDLTARIDNDVWLNQEEYSSIIIMHDKPEPEFPPVFKTLLDHMLGKGYVFLSIL